MNQTFALLNCVAAMLIQVGLLLVTGLALIALNKIDFQTRSIFRTTTNRTAPEPTFLLGSVSTRMPGEQIGQLICELAPVLRETINRSSSSVLLRCSVVRNNYICLTASENFPKMLFRHLVLFLMATTAMASKFYH